jgi:hypothetical protein
LFYFFLRLFIVYRNATDFFCVCGSTILYFFIYLFFLFMCCIIFIDLNMLYHLCIPGMEPT